MTAWFLVPAALSGVAAVAAMEAGWVVTELGHQPWIVYRAMLVSDAVTPSRGVPVTLGVILALYAILTVVSIGVPMIMSRRWRREPPADEEAEQVPYGPAGHGFTRRAPGTTGRAPGILWRAGRSMNPSPETMAVAMILLVVIARTRCSAGRTSAAGSGTCWRAAPSAARPHGSSSTSPSPRSGKPTTCG